MGIVEGINVQIQKNKQSASTSLEVKINNETYLINLKEESSVSIDFVKEIKKKKTYSYFRVIKKKALKDLLKILKYQITTLIKHQKKN